MLDVVRHLAIAWKNLSAYSADHPAVGSSMAQAHKHLREVVAAAGGLSFGVAREALLCGPDRLASPHARDLAHALFVRDVAVLTFEPGLQAEEVQAFLHLLAPDPRRVARPPLAEEVAAAGITHIRVEAVDFSQVRATEDLDSAPPSPGDLWESILRALLAGHTLSAEGRRLVDSREYASAVGVTTLLHEIVAGAEGEAAGAGAGGQGTGGGTGDGAGAGRGPGQGGQEGAGTGGGSGNGTGPGWGTGEGAGASGAAAATAAGKGAGGAGPGQGGSGGGAAVAVAYAGRTTLGGGPIGAAGTAVVEAVRGHLAQLAGPGRLLAVSQVAELVRAMPLALREEIVSAALSALAEDDQGTDAIHALRGAVAPDTMLQALRRVSREMELSPQVARLLHALSAGLEASVPLSDEHPDPALVEELRVLFRNDDADRFNPQDHQALLDDAAVSIPLVDPAARAELGDGREELAEPAVRERVAQHCLELLAQHGPREGHEALLSRVEGCYIEFVAEQRLEPATQLAEELHELARDEDTDPVLRDRIQESLSRLADRELLARVLDALRGHGAEAAALARRLLAVLGAAAGRSFLFALAEEQDKSRRRRLLDLIVAIGPDIVPHATALLADERWYVVRNMLVLLHRLGGRSSAPDIRKCAGHPDLRVRLEAIKCLMSFDPLVAANLLKEAIQDPDPRLAEIAVSLAGSYGIGAALGPLLDIVDRYDFLGARRSIRLKALKSLGELADPAALPRLARFFRGGWLPLIALEERRAAYRALHTFPVEARAAIVERGLRARDPEIRQLCTRLRAEAPAPVAEGGEE